MSTHTPGPWRVANTEPDRGCFLTYIYASPKHRIIDVCPAVACGATEEESEATAHRIVECLNACEGMAPVGVPALLAACIHFLKNEPDVDMMIEEFFAAVKLCGHKIPLRSEAI